MPTAAHAEEVHHYGPNREMIGSGVVTLGISYGASVIVGAQSDHEGDKSLFVPVAGPWMDLTTRGGCNVEPCGHETANKVLLVVDGMDAGEAGVCRRHRHLEIIEHISPRDAC